MPATSTGAITAAQRFIRDEARAVLDIADQIDDNFIRVAQLLLHCGGKVVVTGAGTSGFIARRAAHLLSVSGTPTFFLNPTDALHGSMGALRPDDILIVLSKGGSSSEVNQLADKVRQEGATVVAMTCVGTSDLASLADVAIVLNPISADADPGGVIAMGSTLAYGAWLDALALVLMRARQYGWEKVLFVHPGGAVGKVTTLPAPLEPLSIPEPEGVR